jgi:hypothetical protein
MQCRSCGTEIADKAIVCYRCGAGTADPVRKAVPVRPRRSLLPSAVAAVVLLIGALYMGQASRTAADPEQWQTIAGGWRRRHFPRRPRDPAPAFALALRRGQPVAHHYGGRTALPPPPSRLRRASGSDLH